MKINESSIDSIIRIFAAVLLLYLGFGGGLTGVLAIIADILGVILLLTGVIGFCPLYAFFSFRKLKSKFLCKEHWYGFSIVPKFVYGTTDVF